MAGDDLQVLMAEDDHPVPTAEVEDLLVLTAEDPHLETL